MVEYGGMRIEIVPFIIFVTIYICLIIIYVKRYEYYFAGKTKKILAYLLLPICGLILGHICFLIPVIIMFSGIGLVSEFFNKKNNFKNRDNNKRNINKQDKLEKKRNISENKDNNYDDELKKKVEEYKKYIEKSNNDTVVDKLKQLIPYFSPDDFKKRIRTAFYIIQDGWTKRDLTKALYFISDGTYEQYQLRLNFLKENNLIEVFDNIKIKHISFYKVESRSNTSIKYISVYVCINYEAINYLLSEKTGEYSGDRDKAKFFSDIWCFMRREGPKNLNLKGLIEGFCPNCGTSLEGSRLTKCPACDALLKSGQHDWILTSITKSSEWRYYRNNYIPGVFEVLKNDLSFNFQSIEDKVSVIFWRIIEAERRRIVNPILKVTTDEFAEEFAENCIHSELRNYSEPVLGSIEVLGFVRAEEIEKEKILRDKSLVNLYKDKVLLMAQVTWSGYEPNSENLILKKSLFILRRDINAKTDSNNLFCSLHCPNCGALENNSISNCCEYCDTVINDDKKDWVLSKVIDFNSREANKYIEFAQHYEEELQKEISRREKEIEKRPITKDRIQDKASEYFDKIVDGSFIETISTKDLLTLVISVVLADGKIDSKELESVKRICKLGFISEQELNKTLNALKNTKDPVAYALNSTAIKKDMNVLLMLAHLAASDGEIGGDEAKILFGVADKMNIPRFRLRDEIYKIYKIKIIDPS